MVASLKYGKNEVMRNKGSDNSDLEEAEYRHAVNE